MAFKLDPDYKGVPERLVDLREKYPEGSLEPFIWPDGLPYRIEQIGDKTFVVYGACAYRAEHDERPGMGFAWEPFPGKTPYTEDSELQNAETSAWGRAIVAALASESKNIASTEDMQSRSMAPTPEQIEWKEAMDGLVEVIKLIGDDHRQGCSDYIKERFGDPLDMKLEQIHEAAVIAAGWNGTPPPEPAVDSGGYKPGEEPF